MYRHALPLPALNYQQNKSRTSGHLCRNVSDFIGFQYVVWGGKAPSEALEAAIDPVGEA